ncbi:MAG TPA: SDR family oxidoreductase [Streptosporangiaceae bacterium]|nr:SDR family oxidoreductase [Streptosporangiaceae bacterium]
MSDQHGERGGPGDWLADRAVIVTGASRGIGRAISRRLASAGARVAGFARDCEQLKQTGLLVAAEGGTFLPWVVDVTDAAAVAKAVTEVEGELGRIDVLVNNAAACLRGGLTELPVEDCDAMITSNVNSVVYCCRSVWEPMRAQGGGVIINVSSLSATVSSPGFSVYGATKGFVNTFTATLAAEGRKAGIRVYAIAPGYVWTGLLERVAPEVPADKALGADAVAVAVAALCGPAYVHSSGEVRHLRR